MLNFNPVTGGINFIRGLNKGSSTSSLSYCNTEYVDMLYDTSDALARYFVMMCGHCNNGQF